MTTKELIEIMKELIDFNNTNFKDYVTKAYMISNRYAYKEIIKRLEELEELKDKHDYLRLILHMQEEKARE